MGDPVKVAREVLVEAVKQAVFWRSESQWTSGYRTGAGTTISQEEQQRLFHKMMFQLDKSAERDAEVWSAVQNLERAVRRAATVKR